MYKLDQKVLDAVHEERVFQNRKWGTVGDHPHTQFTLTLRKSPSFG